jgi:hypothetical protein
MWVQSRVFKNFLKASGHQYYLARLYHRAKIVCKPYKINRTDEKVYGSPYLNNTAGYATEREAVELVYKAWIKFVVIMGIVGVDACVHAKPPSHQKNSRMRQARTKIHPLSITRL